MEKKKIRLCMIGFGNAAKAFCTMLNEHREEIENKYDSKVIVTAISTKSRGTVLNPDGLDLYSILDSVEHFGKLDSNEANLLNISNFELIEKSKADVLVELSPLSIKDGQPAISHIEKAFDCNMHVITANKGPVAWDFERLNAAAQKKHLSFLFEGTVMDGTPTFNMVRQTLPGCKVLSFKGILNSTTNFILEEMERGSSYEDAVLEAQRRGFAEANPEMDVDGWDAAAKTSALINALMNGHLSPMDVERTGIGRITISDIQSAQKQNKKIKLVCEGYIDDGKISGRVHPVLLDNSDIFSHIDSTSSVLAITTDLMGEIMIIEKNPEIQQTAYGIYSDLLTLLERQRYERC